MHSSYMHCCLQCGQEGKSVMSPNHPNRIIWVQSTPGHVVASLDKTFCADYLCLVASNKQPIQWTRIHRDVVSLKTSKRVQTLLNTQ